MHAASRASIRHGQVSSRASAHDDCGYRTSIEALLARRDASEPIAGNRNCAIPRPDILQSKTDFHAAVLTPVRNARLAIAFPTASSATPAAPAWSAQRTAAPRPWRRTAPGWARSGASRTRGNGSRDTRAGTRGYTARPKPETVNHFCSPSSRDSSGVPATIFFRWCSPSKGRFDPSADLRTARKRSFNVRCQRRPGKMLEKRHAAVGTSAARKNLDGHMSHVAIRSRYGHADVESTHPLN